MTTLEFVKDLTLKFGYKGNSVIKLNIPIEITYRYYDEEYQCPSHATDFVYAIELLGTDDFELQLANGIVHSSDIEDNALGSFAFSLVNHGGISPASQMYV